MLTAGNTVPVGWTYSICVRVRNSVSMETDQGDKGDACLLCSSLSTLTDHNMKMQPIALSPSFAFNFSLPVCICPGLPLFFSPWPFLLIFPSHTLQSCLSKSLCLVLCIFVCQGQKKIGENGLWRNVCSSSGRQLCSVISTVSDGPNVGLSVTDYVWSCNKIVKLPIYIICPDINWKKNDFLSTRDVNIWGWKRYLLVWHKDECCYLGFSTQSISQRIYSPLSHPPDLSSSHFLHSPSAHTNSCSSSDSSTQSVLYLTLIKPFFLHLLERVEWLFPGELTPSTFPVRA